jgi:hypothetical protein
MGQCWLHSNPWSCSSSEPLLLTTDLNNVCDFNLSKKQAELLGSRVKGWNLLHQDVFWNCQNKFKNFFSQENDPVLCNDVCSVMEALGHQHNPTERRLFIDSSKISIKVVLLHNWNNFPSVLLAHSETWKTPMKIWNYFWKRSSMKNIIGTFVEI